MDDSSADLSAVCCTSSTRRPARLGCEGRAVSARALTSSSAVTASTRRRSPTLKLSWVPKACCAARVEGGSRAGRRGANYPERASETPGGLVLHQRQRRGAQPRGARLPAEASVQACSPQELIALRVRRGGRPRRHDAHAVRRPLLLLVGDILLKTDKMSMAHSLERVPFSTRRCSTSRAPS